jgi:hypothetical protein
VFAKIKHIAIIADTANTNDLVVGAAASNAFARAVRRDHADRHPAAGRAVPHHPPGRRLDGGFSTHKNLKVANGGGTTGVDYTIVLIGTSA